MKNKLLIIVMVLLHITVFSQNIRFEGLIQNSGNEALEMANVMAVNESTKAMDAYAISNDKGKFILNLKVNTSYIIKVSYVGMKVKELAITTQSQNMSQTIIMEDGGIELDGVEIVREMPVSMVGDTLIYNADSFKSGTERKLGDILKNLPGVEVDENGQVKVEGKPVSKLMVEGKDFFDGDTKLGVKNIPSNAVDKVQFLRNYNENSILKSVEDNQEIAMNVKLKEGKKNFWFGEVSAGSGVADKEGHYITNPKLFYYSPKYSINLLSNFNNIGELPLTINDYLKFSGGLKDLMAKGGSSFDISSNEFLLSSLRNNRAKFIKTDFGAFNFSYNPTKEWSLSGFSIFSSSKTELETISRTQYLDGNTNQVATTENRSNRSLQRSDFGLLKLSSSYKPNTDFQLDYDLFAKITKQDEMTRFFRETVSDSGTSNENINTGINQSPKSIKQNLGLFHTLDKKNVLALEAQHFYSEENPFYNANMQSQPFNLIGYIPGQNRNIINQDRFTKTNKLDVKLDYHYKLTKKSNLNFTLGQTYSSQNLHSGISQILDNGNVNDLIDDSNTNNVSYRFSDTFLAAHYKILTGKLTVTPGISFHSYSNNNEQLGIRYKQSFNGLLADLRAVYEFTRSNQLSYNFSLNNNFSDIGQLSEGFIVNSYNSLFNGNRTLENSLSQNHSLMYSKFNSINFENLFVNASYNRTVDGIKMRYSLDGVNQTSSAVNLSLPDETLMVSGQYGRSIFKKLKFSLDGQFMWSNVNNIQYFANTGSEVVVASKSVTQNYSIDFSTIFRHAPNIHFGYAYKVNDYQENRFYTDNPFVKLDYFFLKSFSFVSEYEFYHYYNGDKSVENEYDFLSASLTYQKTKDSHWEYTISGTNLLNTASLNDDSFSQNIVRTSQYRVQPRFIIFSMKYNL